jgi:spore coat polysaccharide biosynthesis protein SpsF (cytidylyltransferase family)
MKQRDIKEDGLDRFCELVEKYEINGVGIVRFTPDDILRHDIVRELVLAFQKEGL